MTKKELMELEVGTLLYNFTVGRRLNCQKEDIMKEVKQVIKKYFKYADCGMFFSSNIVGDPMETVYKKNGVTILICRQWAYFEIFGLTPHEQEEAERYYNSLRNKR